MALTLALTCLVAGAGAVTVYVAARLLFGLGSLVVGVPLDAGRASLAATGVFLLGLVAFEAWLGRGVGLPEVDARRVDREVHPVLAGHVDRVAQQLHLPRPTVAVTPDPSPLAMTTGLTADSATLVVSTGLLATLDDEELEAVVAHELAHVRNRDAAVMTLASVPMVLADGLREWAAADPARDEEDGDLVYGWETVEEDHGEPTFTYRQAGDGDSDRPDDVDTSPTPLVYVVATPFWFVGRLLVGLLARYRELAADRAAAAVTGSPAALASALQSLTDADRPPRNDPRARSAVSAMSVVPDEPPEPIFLGPEGDREPEFSKRRRRLHRFFRTHPPLERRLDVLAEMETKAEGMERD
jgi:heat shock protein HtpX